MHSGPCDDYPVDLLLFLAYAISLFISFDILTDCEMGQAVLPVAVLSGGLCYLARIVQLGFNKKQFLL